LGKDLQYLIVNLYYINLLHFLISVCLLIPLPLSHAATGARKLPPVWQAYLP
jgi:hypothetical protein